MNTLRRYKRHYKLQLKPGTNKIQLVEVRASVCTDTVCSLNPSHFTGNDLPATCMCVNMLGGDCMCRLAVHTVYSRY